MSFLQIKKTSIYLQVTNTPKLIRPLFKGAEGRWVHSIPGCNKVTPDGKKEVIRYFRQVDANFTQWLKNNPDPLWDMLSPEDKFDRNNDRQDFSVRPLHLLPVWDYEEQDVKLARQGNQFFEEMVKWYDQGGDVTACDWMVYTEGKGRRSSYKSVRQDQSPFQCPLDPQALQAKCQELMTQGLNDLLPFKTEEDLIKYVNGPSVTAQVSAGSQQHQLPGYTQQPGFSNQSQQAPQQQVYTPGGTPNAQYSSVPMGGQLPVNTNQNFTTQPPSPYQPQQAVAIVPQQQPIQQSSQMPVGGYTPQPAAVNFTPQPAAANFTPQPPPAGVSGYPVGAPPPKQDDVPNAPLRSTQPVFAPPVTTPHMTSQQLVPQTQQMPQQMQQPTTQTQQPTQQSAQQQVQQPQVQSQVQNSDPAGIVVDFGKHTGKNLGWILQNDRSYLTFLKGKKKEWIGIIDSLLGSSVSQETQVATQAIQQVPVADESQRENICSQINQKLLEIPDFQGPGIRDNMYPFLKNTIGTTDFSNAPIPDLVRLNQAIDGLVAQQGA